MTHLNAVTVISFGYGHGDPPPAHLTVDVRTHFRDPHLNPGLRYLTGTDEPVFFTVIRTPGVPELINSVTATATAFLAAPAPGPVTVAIGCAGGRHRSVAIAEVVSALLPGDVGLVHRDIGRPVIERAALTAGPAKEEL